MWLLDKKPEKIIKDALKVLGKKQLSLIIHGSSFPDAENEDTAYGNYNSNGARNLVINNLTPYDVINILNRKYGQSIDMEEACITYVDDMFKVQKNY